MNPLHTTLDNVPLTVVSFFSGIGGLDLGFERAGFSIEYQCEIHDYCTSVLERHWPTVPRWRDIKEILDANQIPNATVWVGGFPCQDVSVARTGQRLGLNGKHSGLFHEFSRLVEQRLPRIFVIENVPGIFSSNEGRDFQIIICKMVELGYCVGWRVLNSKYFGVPQSRRRVFIVGCYRERNGPGEILFESESSDRHIAASGSNGKETISSPKESFGDPVKGPIVKKIAFCLCSNISKQTGTDWLQNYVSYPDGRVRRLMPVECERLQGFPDGWTIPSENSKFYNVDRIDILRYRALGNAVTVQVAEWLASRIKSFLLNTSSRKTSH